MALGIGDDVLIDSDLPIGEQLDDDRPYQKRIRSSDGGPGATGEGVTTDRAFVHSKALAPLAP